jgi:hypothetical protein
MDFVVLLRIVAYSPGSLNTRFFCFSRVGVRELAVLVPHLANDESKRTRMIGEGWLVIRAVDMAGFPHPLIASPNHFFASQLFTRGLLVNRHRGLRL